MPFDNRPRLFPFLQSIFSPPFPKLSLVVWGYFIFSFLICPTSMIIVGDLPDSDDYMYLTQALDLLHGQGWFDHIQQRMNPPDGTYIHFSNLLTGFYALPIAVLSHLTDETSAAIIVAALMPPLFLLVFFAVMRWAAIPFVGRNWAGITAPIMLFASQTIFQFTPGHVDHHGLEAMLAVGGIGGIARMIEDPGHRKAAIIAALFLSLGLVIALEILPVYLLLAGLLGLWSMIEGNKASRNTALFGAVFFAANLVFLALTRAPENILTPDTMSYSIVYIFIAGGAALCFLAISLASLTRLRWLRFAAGVTVGVLTGGLFFHAFPQLKAGPYGDVDPALAKMLFDNVGEALPLIHGEHWFGGVMALLWPIMAVPVAGYFIFTAPTRGEKWRWLFVVIPLLICALLAGFYQMRLGIYAQILCTLPMAAFLKQGWTALGRKPISCSVCAARFGLILLVAPLPVLFIPALLENRPLDTGILLFPNPTTGGNACDMHFLATMLNIGTNYKGRSLTIMNFSDQGPEILLRTRHKVLAGNFHMNVGGNLDSFKFFTTSDPSIAESIARKRNADLVVFCSVDVPDAYKLVDPTMVTLDENAKRKPQTQSMLEQLIDGKTPVWLKKIQFPFMGNMMLFDVLPPDHPAEISNRNN